VYLFKWLMRVIYDLYFFCTFYPTGKADLSVIISSEYVFAGNLTNIFLVLLVMEVLIVYSNFKHLTYSYASE